MSTEHPSVVCFYSFIKSEPLIGPGMAHILYVNIKDMSLVPLLVPIIMSMWYWYACVEILRHTQMISQTRTYCLHTVCDPLQCVLCVIGQVCSLPVCDWTGLLAACVWLDRSARCLSGDVNDLFSPDSSWCFQNIPPFGLFHSLRDQFALKWLTIIGRRLSKFDNRMWLLMVD